MKGNLIFLYSCNKFIGKKRQYIPEMCHMLQITEFAKGSKWEMLMSYTTPQCPDLASPSPTSKNPEECTVQTFLYHKERNNTFISVILI